MSEVSPVYGPVRSWRFGRSLGIDPIGAVSTCSFNCIYCQLGDIQVVTNERRVYVPTERLETALRNVKWDEVDVVTFSGSGEPTLATNLGEMIALVKKCALHKWSPKAGTGTASLRSASSQSPVSEIPVHILTNATLFHLPEVRAAVAGADVIACKLDAASDAMLQKFNRPAPGITVESIIEGILKLKAEYKGKLEIQTMFMPMNKGELEGLAALIRRIQPAEVQLNTPKRAYPLEWHVETRGEHEKKEFEWPTRKLSVITPEQAAEIETYLRKETDTPITSVYRV